MITSRLAAKPRTTLPPFIRAALGVKEGDKLAYSIENGRVILLKAPFREYFGAFMNGMA